MTHLFTIPSDAITSSIESVIETISRILPIPQQHRRDLPFAIKDLSRILTEERGALNRPYWAAPRFLTAYAYYFLPWNLYRLAFILPGLKLNLLSGATILDFGTGPLTLPLALWCARPELRSVPLTFHCVDTAQKPMDIGLAILRDLDPDNCWTITLERSPLEHSLHKPKKGERGYDLIMAGNVLNELAPSKGGTLEERIGGVMRACATCLAPGGTVFLVEPGTRLGGKVIALARKAALSNNFSALAPCTHQNPCPAEEEQAYFPAAPIFSGWCHFLCSVYDAPVSLHALTEKAGFNRRYLAVSFVALEGGTEMAHNEASFDMDELEDLYNQSLNDDDEETWDGFLGDGTGDTGWAKKQNKHFGSHQKRGVYKGQQKERVPGRIISGDILLDKGIARYVCCEDGLALAFDAGRVSSGAEVLLELEQDESRDMKSGARMARCVKEHSNDQVPRVFSKRKYPQKKSTCEQNCVREKERSGQSTHTESATSGTKARILTKNRKHPKK